ncbi:MAG: PAS domain S-box protein [Leptospiraceae bacterium]|nr:PAS domain S-box protein [Leptospiraceae bacterium]
MKTNNVLVLDDEIEILKTINRQLRKKYNLFLANSVKEANWILETNPIQVILTDQRMPDMNGSDYIKEIKIKYRNIVCLVLTAYSDVNAFKDFINFGNVYKFIMKPWDNTELEKYIQEAFELHQRKYLILDSFRNYFVCRFLPDTTLTYVNKAFCEHFQVKHKDMIGKKFLYFLPQLEKIRINNYIKSIQNDAVNIFENHIVFPPNEVRWYKWTTNAVYDENGDFIEYQATGDDITQSKQIESETNKLKREMQISYIEFFNILNNSPIGIYVTDTEGCIVYVNKQFCSLTGLAMYQLIGKPFYEFLDGEDRAFFLDLHLQFCNSHNTELIVHKELVTPRGKVSVRCQKNKYFQSDRTTKIVVYTTDLTDIINAHKKTKEALEKEKYLNELNSRFITFASHEFRTPITIMDMSAQILEKYSKSFGELERKQLEHIKKASNHLIMILEDALFIHRYNLGKLEIKCSLVNIETFCKAIIDEFQKFHKDKVKIHYYCLKNEPVHTDTILLKYIIKNLLSNSIKYSNKKPVTLKIKTLASGYSITIADRGIGISNEDKKHLFTPFHRGKNIDYADGLGLGLVIVKNSVELLKGSIQMKSKENCGTVFRVKLPRLPNKD